MTTRNRFKTILTLGAVAMAILGLTTPSAAQTITTDKATYTYGEDVVISWASGPGNALDWVGVVSDDLGNYIGWAYTDGVAGGGSTGVPAGNMTADYAFIENEMGAPDADLWYPLPVGGYTVELYVDDSYTVIAAATFTITPGAVPTAEISTPTADVLVTGGTAYAFVASRMSRSAVPGDFSRWPARLLHLPAMLRASRRPTQSPLRAAHGILLTTVCTRSPWLPTRLRTRTPRAW